VATSPLVNAVTGTSTSASTVEQVVGSVAQEPLAAAAPDTQVSAQARPRGLFSVINTEETA